MLFKYILISSFDYVSIDFNNVYYSEPLPVIPYSGKQCIQSLYETVPILWCRKKRLSNKETKIYCELNNLKAI